MKKVILILVSIMMAFITMLSTNQARADSNNLELTVTQYLSQNENRRDLLAVPTPDTEATFEIYDITDYYNQEVKNEANLATFTAKLTGMTQQQLDQFIKDQNWEMFDCKLTNEEGKVYFNVPNNEKHAYLIVQRKIVGCPERPLEKVEKAIPTVILTPIVDENGIHADRYELFTKTALFQKMPYALKYGVDASGQKTPLAGVTFGIFKEVDGKKLFLTPSHEFVESQNPVDDEKLMKFTTNESGIILFPDLDLPEGTYYLSELKTADGYQISEAAQRIEVVIEGGQPVVVQNTELKNLINGQIQDEDLANENLVVLNYQEGVTPPTDPTDPTDPINPDQSPGSNLTNTGSISALPRTNFVQSYLTPLIGIAIIIFAVYLWRRKIKEN